MARLTADEKRLLAENESKTASRPADDTKPLDGDAPVDPKSAPQEKETPAAGLAPATGDRGPNTPVQHDDDGWGDTPVQMRG